MRRREYYANTTDPESLILDKIPALQNIHWKALHSRGTSNRHFLGKRDQDLLVLRLNAGASVSFGADRLKEAVVLGAIQPFDWAPEIIDIDPVAGWCLQRYYPETPCALIADQVLDIVIDFQTVQNVPVFSYTRMLNLYQQKLAGSKTANKKLIALRTMLDALPDQQYCLVHHDIHKGNILSAGNQLVFIDWEYAGLGCPWLDLAFIQRNWPFDVDRLNRFPVAQHYSLVEVREVLILADRFNQQLAELWYEVREK